MALRLHWPDERYARVYCRDTIEWQALSWHAKSLWMHLNRKADRRGRIDLGRVGLRGVAALVGHPDMWPVLEPALAELLADGCVCHEGSALVIPDFVEAQEAVSSGAKRMRELRERQREAADEAGDLPGREAAGSGAGAARDASDETSRQGDETSRGDETSPNVTRGYGTARTARHGTAGNGTGNGTAPPATPSAPTGVALSRAFAAELDAEASREDARRAHVLDALGGEWRTVFDVATRLRRSPNTVESDLLELRRRGLVQRAERGSPPVAHWQRAAGSVAA